MYDYELRGGVSCKRMTALEKTMLYELENTGQDFQRIFAVSFADTLSQEGVGKSLAFQFLVGLSFGWLVGVAVISAFVH